MSNHPNMSYCMWQNTFLALQQCAASLEEKDRPEGYEEERARAHVLQLCGTLLEAIGVDIESHDVDACVHSIDDSDDNNG